MNKELSKKINLLLRSEKAMLKLEMNRRSRQAVLAAIGIIAVLATLVMLNVTAYLFLEVYFEPKIAALSLTTVDLFIAILFLVIASRQELGREAEAVSEIRDYARQELAGEIEVLQQETAEIRESFSKVSSGISSVFNRDFSAVKAVIPLVEMFVKSRKK